MSNFFAAAAKTNTLPSQQIQTRTAFFCSNIRKFPQKYSVEVNIIYPLAYKSDTRMLLREFKSHVHNNRIAIWKWLYLVTLDSSQMLQSGLEMKVLVHNSSKALNCINLHLLFISVQDNETKRVTFNKITQKSSECIFVPFVRSFVPILESSGSGSSKKSKRSFL